MPIRLIYDERGDFDDLFAEDATIHIERMSDGHVWLSVTTRDAQVHLNLETSRHRARISVVDSAEGNVVRKDMLSPATDQREREG